MLDNVLEWCYTSTMNINLRLPDDIHMALKASAEINRRSLNSEILTAIEFYFRVGSNEGWDKVKEVSPEAPLCRWCSRPESEHKTTDRHKFKAVKTTPPSASS